MSNHVFDASLSAPLGRTYEIDAGTNFTAWSFAAGGVVTESVPFTDGNAPQFPRRYYRASLDWTIRLTNTYLLFKTNSGVDGRIIAYPYNWNTNQGTDGRLVAYPPGWSTNRGGDGRLIAYPPGWSTNKGPDGRLVAFPTNGCTMVTNADGRITVHPTSGVPGLGTNAYESANWKLATGGDGRTVGFPASNFPTNTGKRRPFGGLCFDGLEHGSRAGRPDGGVSCGGIFDECVHQRANHRLPQFRLGNGPGNRWKNDCVSGDRHRNHRTGF